MDRGMADRLCPGAAGDRESWQSGVERDAEAVLGHGQVLPGTVAPPGRHRLQRPGVRNADLLP